MLSLDLKIHLGPGLHCSGVATERLVHLSLVETAPYLSPSPTYNEPSFPVAALQGLKVSSPTRREEWE